MRAVSRGQVLDRCGGDGGVDVHRVHERHCHYSQWSVCTVKLQVGDVHLHVGADNPTAVGLVDAVIELACCGCSLCSPGFVANSAQSGCTPCLKGTVGGEVDVLGSPLCTAWYAVVCC